MASSRLARGDASVAIGVNMHLVAVLNMERRRQVAAAGGQERRARAHGAETEIEKSWAAPSRTARSSLPSDVTTAPV